MITRKTRYGIGLLSALCVLSFWATREQQEPVEEERAKFDLRVAYALANFELRYFDEEGQPAVHLKSPSFTSDADSGDGFALNPVLEVHHEGMLWNIIADSATVTDAQDYILLNGDVHLTRTGAEPIDWMEIDGHEVTLVVNPRIAHSDQPVEMEDLSGRMTATGFRVDMINNKFELNHDVKGVYVLP